jgi:hypothetical protein
MIWHNRSFYYSGDGRLCVGNTKTPSGACTTLPNQTATGQCVSGAKYWDIGVLGDASTAPGSVRLNPSFSIITSITGYTGSGLQTTDPALVNPYCNGARVMPELGAVTNPPSAMNLQVAATVDEGNNYVNLRYGPLFVENPSSKALLGNFHLPGTASSAYNNGTSTGAPTHDYDGQTRPNSAAPRSTTPYDIGADEYWPSGTQPPTLPY